jgi:hypothetical protein
MSKLIGDWYKPQPGDLVEVVHTPKSYHYMILEVLSQESEWKFVVKMYLILENETLRATLDTTSGYRNVYLVSRVGENNGQ